MPRRVLDTNILISHWHRMAAGRNLATLTPPTTARWGRDVANAVGSNAIVTPVQIEFLCGARTGHQLRLTRAYLDAFEIVDSGDIRAEDWVVARRLAERIPRDGGTRQLGDCLIRAICERLHLEVLTGETRFPRRSY